MDYLLLRLFATSLLAGAFIAMIWPSDRDDGALPLLGVALVIIGLFGGLLTVIWTEWN